MKAAAKENAPIYIVRGNNDKEWAEHLPHHLEFTLAGMNFYVVHNKKELPADLGTVRSLFSGIHTGILTEKKDGRLWLNPGSCGKRRFDQDITLAILRIDGDACSVERSILSMSAPEKRFGPVPCLRHQKGIFHVQRS